MFSIQISIPIVDLANYQNPATLGHALGSAGREIGFFVLVNHGMATNLIHDAFHQSKRFFASTEAEKATLSIRHSPHNRGYVGMMEEQLDPSRPGDVKEAFNVGGDCHTIMSM
jgi:isopenicillin N synthase-like dioxygenase